MIDTIADLQRLVRDGFSDWRSLGDVAVKEKDGLLLFNYTTAAQVTGRWNAFEQMSRGLILDAKTGKIVARPFPKFWNWGEGGRTTDAPLVRVAEKMDGSLGIAYVWRGEWHVATRGSFDSEQAQWATGWLRNHLPDDLDIEGEWTQLFEIIYPGNRVVVDYGERAELVLLAIRNNRTGEYSSQDILDMVARKRRFTTPWLFPARKPEHIADLCRLLDANHEGFVATFADGQMFKFKGDAYKELHRMISGLSYKRAVEAVANGTVDQVREVIPDEFLGEFNGWVEEIEKRVNLTIRCVEQAFQIAPTNADRKTFAQWANENYPAIAPYLFMRLDGKDYRPSIFKREFN